MEIERAKKDLSREARFGPGLTSQIGTKPSYEYLNLRLTSIVALVPVITTLAAIPILAYWRRMAPSRPDAKATDPPLLERNSELKSYTTTRATYPGIRVFYRRHQQANQLPTSPAPVPLLVFIHGLGGSVAQFSSLLTSLTPIASCLAVDLPGCGVSDFEPRSWDAYKLAALVELLETVIDDYREKKDGQGVVLIGHSLGASLATLLANPRVGGDRTLLSKYVLGLVAICPSTTPPLKVQASLLRKLFYLPDFIIDLWRAWDARGGLESRSVHRFVGADADAETKRLQTLFNGQSRTPVFKRVAYGALPTVFKEVVVNGIKFDGIPADSIPTVFEWLSLAIPVFLIGGGADEVTPPESIEALGECLSGESITPSNSSAARLETTNAPAQPQNPRSSADNVAGLRDEDFEQVERNGGTDEPTDDPETPNEQPATIPPLPLHPKKVVKTLIMPKPASHGLLYTPTTAPVLAGLISDFLANHVTGRLALSWQLQYLCQDGKWDVKNLEKWQKVEPVSEQIGGVFRAMKTLRQVDETHCPEVFTERWGGVIKDIIDISHDNPVYDPQGLEAGSIRYHKFPTVSKVPPSDVEVKGFIDLVDKVRADQKKRAESENWGDNYAVGVHCHYGFNRTGYFLVCYLVERCGFTTQGAIEHFAEARPKGIKHAHFKDRLFVRYSGVKADHI